MKINTSSYIIKITLSILGILLGIIFTNSYLFIPFTIWVLVIVMLFTNDGIEFDITKQQFRYYKTIFGITKGAWLDFSKYVNIVILSKTGTKNPWGGSIGLIYGGTLGKVGGMKDAVNYIYIVDRSHRNKIEIASISGFEEAKKKAFKIGEKLELPVVKYNPIISDKTKRKKAPNKS